MHVAAVADYPECVSGPERAAAGLPLHCFAAKVLAYVLVLEIRLMGRRLCSAMIVMNGVTETAVMMAVHRHLLLPFADALDDADHGDVSWATDSPILPMTKEPLAHSPRPWSGHHNFRPL